MSTTTTKPPARSLVALHLPTSVPALISVAKAIVDRMTGNASIPNPVPTLAEVTAAITALEAAESAAKSKVTGAVAARDEKRAALVTVMHELKASVQKAADANREQAPALIQGVGMIVKKAAVRPKRVFDAKQGAVSGSIHLVAASAGHRASYEWELSTDGGKTWVIAPATLQAKTTMTGLQPGASTSFRYRPVTKTGAADWSQPIALIVK
jgi:hypothetical protein